MKARKGTHNGRSVWVVRFTENGKRRRRFFPSQVKATRWIREQEKEVATIGKKRAELLTEDLKLEAAECVKRLAPYGKTLTDAVDMVVNDLESRGASKTLTEVSEAFENAKKRQERSPRYLADIKSRLRPLKAYFGEQERIKAIDTARAEQWLATLAVGAQSVNHYRRVGHSLFEYALNRGWVESNPFARTEKATVKRTAPGIFTGVQMQEMMEAAKGDPHLVAWCALGAYAGLRPAEISRVDWQHIHLEAGQIKLTADITKGARVRNVEIRPILKEHLGGIRQLAGPVVWPTFSNSKKLRDFKKKLSFQWPHDGLRHSFATYHLAAFENAAKTSLQLGHGGDAQMLWNHYNAPNIDKTEALAWWGEEQTEAPKESRHAQ